jgi:hypothetical protein
MPTYSYHVEIVTSENWLQDTLTKWSGTGWRCVRAERLPDGRWVLIFEDESSED